MLHCLLRSPDRTFFDGEAVSVTARSARGQFTILAEHAPLLARLATGPIRIRTAQKVLAFACAGGTLSTDGARVEILGADVVSQADVDGEDGRARLADPALSPEERATLEARIALWERVEGRDE